MDKSQNKLYKTGKKWVITAFAATTIGTSGYTLFNPNVAYADDGQTVTTNGNYVEMALNASKEAQSSSDIVSSISDKWQYCPGGDSLVDLKDQASNDAVGAAVASSKVAQPQTNEQEQSLATSDALSYAADASSVAVVATSSADSISNVASSMASSTQYKLGIYKSFASSVNVDAHNLSTKLSEWNQNKDIQDSPALYAVYPLNSMSVNANNKISSADSMLVNMNLISDSINNNIINKNNINSLYEGMSLASKYNDEINDFNKSFSYGYASFYASSAIASKHEYDGFHKTADSLSTEAKNTNDKNMISRAESFSTALSAYDISRDLYIHMYRKINDDYNHVKDNYYERNNYFEYSLSSLGWNFDSVRLSMFDVHSDIPYRAIKTARYAAEQANNRYNDPIARSAISAIDSLTSSAELIEKQPIQANSSSINSSAASTDYDNPEYHSYIEIISSAADQTKNYADNVSSLNTKWGKNNSSLTSLSNQINDYANSIRNELDKSKNLVHSQTLEQSSLSVSYASSLVSKASENNSTANSIANSISAATSTNSDTHKNSNTSSSHLNNSSVPNSQNNYGYNPNNNFIYKIPTTSSNSGAPNNSSQASSTNSSAEYYVPNSTTSSTTSQSASSASTSSSAATSSSETISSSSPITTSNNSDSTVYKKLYQKVQKNLTKEIAINKSKVAKFKKAYQKTKNKRDKAKQLKAYQDAQYKLKLAQKHYRSINK